MYHWLKKSGFLFRSHIGLFKPKEITIKKHSNKSQSEKLSNPPTHISIRWKYGVPAGQKRTDGLEVYGRSFVGKRKKNYPSPHPMLAFIYPYFRVFTFLGPVGSTRNSFPALFFFSKLKRKEKKVVVFFFVFFNIKKWEKNLLVFFLLMEKNTPEKKWGKWCILLFERRERWKSEWMKKKMEWGVLKEVPLFRACSAVDKQVWSLWMVCGNLGEQQCLVYRILKISNG